MGNGALLYFHGENLKNTAGFRSHTPGETF